ncbi:MAG: hypothetical protein WDN00_07060 [Limisphaerales bacterium]
MIVLISMAIRCPFTLQYAREGTPETLWREPEFIRVNYVITAVWAAAFAVMVAADLVMFYMPKRSHKSRHLDDDHRRLPPPLNSLHGIRIEKT